MLIYFSDVGSRLWDGVGGYKSGMGDFGMWYICFAAYPAYPAYPT
ncbi:hypothetical protein ERHA54_08720 [Erwinia rhapontici]|nr:hypothetical protein ERHA54_08720 [Erwinia rhapontici]